MNQPDNNYIEQDHGFLFTAWGIHVAAATLDEAKAHIKEYYGKDVDHDTPPPKQQEAAPQANVPSEGAL